MMSPIKNLFFSFIFNFCLLSLLIIGIQNNSKKSKVNLIVDKTINLPIGFIVGTSFISGSIMGGVLNIKPRKNN